MRPRRPAARLAAPAPFLAAAVAAAALAVPTAAPAAAKKRHAPCPTNGTTLYRASKYAPIGLRVYRVGDELRACTRQAGKARRIRVLGPWTAETQVAAQYGLLVWTARTTAPDGTAADVVRAIETSSGRRVLTVTKAAVATSPTTPAAADTVLTLRTDGQAIAWVTSRGRVALRVPFPNKVPARSDGSQAFHVGAIYGLRDVGAALAPGLVDGLRFLDDSETDECGGTISQRLVIPPVEGVPGEYFGYYEAEATPAPGCN
ncbi:hypothetical protein [Patulibacter minatonensis]|uniref:hypothetical protein n=1 Tax=Patulibacter minatonensis TaxID=298163 RepID=UPI000479BBE0|nr:hypothetical protein [Patulibacter minatonensis]